MTPPTTDPPARPRPSATLHYGRANGSRLSLTLDGRDSRELDARIIARINDLRAAGNKMVRTEMHIDGEEWVYEYNTVGHVEHIFRNGEVTP